MLAKESQKIRAFIGLASLLVAISQFILKLAGREVWPQEINVALYILGISYILTNKVKRLRIDKRLEKVVVSHSSLLRRKAQVYSLKDVAQLVLYPEHGHIGDGDTSYTLFSHLVMAMKDGSQVQLASKGPIHTQDPYLYRKSNFPLRKLGERTAKFMDLPLEMAEFNGWYEEKQDRMAMGWGYKIGFLFLFCVSLATAVYSILVYTEQAVPVALGGLFLVVPTQIWIFAGLMGILVAVCGLLFQYLQLREEAGIAAGQSLRRLSIMLCVAIPVFVTYWAYREYTADCARCLRISTEYWQDLLRKHI